jgi:aminoglycoside phosphotransferase (APT) family kinase protein
MAAHLARIHSLEGSRPDLAFLPRHEVGCPELSGSRPPQVDRSWEEGRIREALAAAWPLPQRNASVLLHGDYWPGNILWRAGKLVAVIDWEDASVGDPLADLAIGRLDLAWIYGVEAMMAFTKHYIALRALDDAALPYWDLCAALRLARLAGPDLAGWAAFYAPYGRHDLTERTIRERYRSFVAQAWEQMAAR